MAKVRTPNQKSKYRELNKRLASYVLLVEQIYDELNLEVAHIAMSTGYDGSKPFRFKDYPKTKDRVNKLKKKFVEELQAVIYRGTSNEWKQSNLVQDLLADRVLKAFGVKHRGKKEKVYYQVNSDALKAFQDRKISGMGLSANLWNQAANYREELEYAISSAIQKGTSAVTLSKRLSKYLQDFPKLQKDYKQKFGKAVECNDCEYRSIRLARSEINMAYRTAEQTRWQQMDFVVGYEIKLSAKHPCHDVCDSLAGKYPKDFKWTGWHPNDMCYVVPILNTAEEFWSDSTTSVNEVKDVPEGFKKWLAENDDRILRSKNNGTLPYFLRDNPGVLKIAVQSSEIKKVHRMASDVKMEVQGLADGIAGKYGAVVTPINLKTVASITRKVNAEGISPFDLKDAVRTTIVADRDDIGDVIKDLTKDGSFLRLKVQRPDDFIGYSGNIVNIKTSNGLIGEIQVNTAKMIYAKEKPADAIRILGEDLWKKIRKDVGVEGGLGHEFYEKARVLNNASAEYAEIVKKSIAYYRLFQ